MDKAAREASQMHKDFGGKFTNAVEAAIASALRERDAEIARLKGKRGNAEYRATVARRALEYSDRFACECEDGSNVCWSCAASDALDALDDALAALDRHDQGERGGGENGTS